jgi:hypothetical protein
VVVGGQNFGDALFAELITVAVLCFGDAVGDEKKDLPGFEFDFLLFKLFCKNGGIF